MKIQGFRIENFKGIKHADIDFSDHETARVHTLVGLNESGKTTLLEALHSFSPDAETELVVENARSIDAQREQWVPRDKISTFTGEVSIAAFIQASNQDWLDISNILLRKCGISIRYQDLPTHFTCRLTHIYDNGDYQTTVLNLNVPQYRVKTGKQRKFREPTTEEVNYLCREIRKKIPTVAYYPTFVFDFPEKIYLTDGDRGALNRFYKQLFQDILDYDGSGLNIKDSIVGRLHREELQGPWEWWFGSFVGTSDEEKVKQVIARAEKAVTEVVFSKWNEVFGEDVGNKEIAIDLNYEKGNLIKLDDGTEEEPSKHEAYIRFRIKEGSNRYAINDRSLGFRWFFSFLLFTQFRIHRGKSRPTIFLFDEPASNLHAAAQIKLLESFPSIAKPPHRLIYTTHSHYMVQPQWLEQAYIVFNSLTKESDAVIDEGVRSDSDVDVKAVPYRRFLHEFPTKTSYFQPIMDTLEVPASKFDYKAGGLIVEGKSDYYMVRLMCQICGESDAVIFPATGSGTMGSLVSLHRGWGLPVRVLFDSDQGGADGRKKLKSEFSLSDQEICSVGQVSDEFVTIEDVLSESDLVSMVGCGGRRKKREIRMCVQEIIASGTKAQFDSETIRNMKNLFRY